MHNVFQLAVCSNVMIQFLGSCYIVQYLSLEILFCFLHIFQCYNPAPSAVSEHSWTQLDTVEHGWTQLDTVGHSWTRLDTVGHG